MARAKPDRTKPHCNIGTIGRADHGKTVLTAAIMKVLATRLPSDTNKIVDSESVDKAPEERERGITVNTAHIEYETKAHRYTHANCPGHANYIKNMITGVTQMDGAILVVATTDGVMAQTHKHILFTRQVNVSYIVIFMNKCDMVSGEEPLGLAEVEIRELLNDYGFPGDDVLIIRGSALKVLEDLNGPWGDRIMDLMDAVDEAIPEPERENGKPSLVPVEDVFMTTGRGTVAAGRVKRGTLRLNGEVELIGIEDEGRETIVTGTEMFRKLLDYVEAGDNVGLPLHGVNRKDALRGQILVKPDMVTCHTKFAAQVYVPTRDEGSRHALFFNSYHPQFHFRTTDVTGVYVLPEGTEMCMPGDNVEMTVELIYLIAIEQDPRLAIREDSRTIDSGRVVKIIE